MHLVKSTRRTATKSRLSLRRLRRLLCVLLVLLFFVDLVHLRLERFVEFLDMPDVGAEVAGEEAQRRGVTGARQAGTRAYVDIARRLDGDPHVVLEFEEA